MAAVARVAFPSTRRRPSTLPFSSTTALRTPVPSAPSERASTGYFGAKLYASRFSAPLEERMIALFSPGRGVLDEVAATASFLVSLELLSLALLRLDLLVSDLARGVAVAVMFPEADGATALPGIGDTWAGAVAAADVVFEPVVEPVAESGVVVGIVFASVGKAGAGEGSVGRASG